MSKNKIVIIVDLGSLKNIDKDVISYWFYKWMKESFPFIHVVSDYPVTVKPLMDNQHRITELEHRLYNILYPKIKDSTYLELDYEFKNDFMVITVKG